MLAGAPGVVRQIVDSPLGCGTGVVLAHPPFRPHTAYCHMQRILVRVGDTVARGQPIGLVGTSGNAVGVPHVHLELCTTPCASHPDGDLGGTRDPLAVAAG